MDTDLGKLCPYAPYTSVLTVIRHMRDRDLKEPVTSQLITTISVAEGNASRTIQALRFLNLLDEEGYITPNFRAIGNAPDNEYPELLGQTLQEAYSHVFMALDPATASDDKFTTAFRYYHPKAQRQRMIMLFKGLCREAGIIPGGAPETITRPRVTASKSSDSTVSLRKQPPIISESPSQASLRVTSASAPVNYQQHTTDTEYMLLQNLIQQLPKGTEKRWTRARRDKWMQAVAANIDVLIEVEEEES